MMFKHAVCSVQKIPWSYYSFVLCFHSLVVLEWIKWTEHTLRNLSLIYSLIYSSWGPHLKDQTWLNVWIHFKWWKVVKIMCEKQQRAAPVVGWGGAMTSPTLVLNTFRWITSNHAQYVSVPVSLWGRKWRSEPNKIGSLAGNVMAGAVGIFFLNFA